MSEALVVDDDDAIRELVTYALSADGFHVTTAPDGASALGEFAHRTFDVVLLDVNLPGIDGFSLVERIRRTSRVPIVMLTVRHAEPDIVRALDLGADDYVVKPFSPRELLARVHTVIRRSRQDQVLVVRHAGGETRIDLATRLVTHSDPPMTVELTAAESEVLRVLVRAHGRPVPRSALAGALPLTRPHEGSRSLDVHVFRLRQKLDPLGRGDGMIRTVRGVGYMWTGGERPGGPSIQGMVVS